MREFINDLWGVNDLARKDDDEHDARLRVQVRAVGLGRAGVGAKSRLHPLDCPDRVKGHPGIVEAVGCGGPATSPPLTRTIAQNWQVGAGCFGDDGVDVD